MFVYICTFTCMAKYAYEGQRRTCRSQFSPTMWVLGWGTGKEGTHVVSLDCKHFNSLSHLTSPVMVF